MDRRQNAGKVTDWVKAETLFRMLEDGDLVEFERGLFKHWGVSAGRGIIHVQPVDDSQRRGDVATAISGTVAHAMDPIRPADGGWVQNLALAAGGATIRRAGSATTGTIASSNCGQPITQDNGVEVKIVLSTLFEAAADGPCRINNGSDRKRPPFHPNKIIQRAKQRLGEVSTYNVLNGNCEHFVNWCRYGKEFSDQVISTLCAVAGGLALGLAGTGVAIVGAGVVLAMSFLR